MTAVHYVGDFEIFPYDVCGKAFGQNSTRDKHMTRVHHVHGMNVRS